MNNPTNELTRNSHAGTNIFPKLVLCIVLICIPGLHASSRRWTINEGQTAISWYPGDSIPHHDHIEMSGRKISVVLRYGVNDAGRLELNRSIIWPMLRTIPNNTHASLMRRFDWNPLSVLHINGRSFTNEQVEKITLNGILKVQSRFSTDGNTTIRVLRECFPSSEAPAYIEHFQLINTSNRILAIEVPAYHSVITTDPSKGVTGSYRLVSTLVPEGSHTLHPSDTLVLTATITGLKTEEPALALNGTTEKQKREKLIAQWTQNLVLESPDNTINQLFAFSKIRACESIFDTKGGPMHGPGGESYYAAIWANDQAEYINPFFPFTGYEYGNESAINAFRHFARYMNDEWKPIPSSIIAEGTDTWNGAGDRGDAAMIAYGAARFALALGKKEVALQLWPLIVWCIEYSERKTNNEGVVTSDSDELEGRFPSGEANLCTSSLYYDALLSATYLSKEIGKQAVAPGYLKRAERLRKSIEQYFGAKVEGFNTYAYYKGNQHLRSWICIPLSVGINERAAETLNALFSPKLWTPNGLLTQSGSETFWDRSTLYALRGAYTAGETQQATDFLKHYSSTRLLGEHVPYAIEAWPEGNQRHLSAESALYARIITEGLFGIRPTGLNTFRLTPRLPQEWNYMHLRNIQAFGATFDLEITRTGTSKLNIQLIQDKTIRSIGLKEGSSIELSVNR